MVVYIPLSTAAAAVYIPLSVGLYLFSLDLWYRVCFYNVATWRLFSNIAEYYLPNLGELL
jgi:hypothetical protein